ncbi:hypothetical protein [Methylosinus sp. Sm6]|uniref:hypothetical protein n=1 Tax=Methylosinus sp. Sm6 TaxID=2866948 RepID=UPI001C99F083|nr:hypothetical protein [Methylosinus sp. Sm6]MBY6239793.1 hypothetical protein [Methylosinus sp. Sm6]
MAGTSLTSTLSVKLIDDVSKPARTVAQALKDAERAAKAAAKGMAETKASDRFVKSLAGLKLSAKDIEAVAAAWKDFAKAQGLADDAAKWTKQQIADVRAWERAQLAALREVKREQTAFHRDLAAQRALGGAAGVGLIPGMSAIGGPHAQNIAAGKRMIEGMSTAAEVRAGLLSPTASAALGALAGKAGHVMPLAGGFAAYEVLRKATEAAAERQHVVTGAKLAGMRETELARAEARAKEIAGGGLTLSGSEVLELFKEGRSAVQHPEEMFDLVKPLAQAASVLKGMGVDNANLADIVKGAESLGLMNDPKRFRSYLEGQVKAMQVMGKTITTEQVYEAAKYSKSAGATLSDEFLNTTLPSLIQEMHGSSAGDALSMLVRKLRGGLQRNHLPVQLLNEMGLLTEPSKIRRAKGSDEIMGYTGKVKGDDLLASDPGRWFREVFKPAAERHGDKTLSEQVALLNKILPSTAANLGRILIQQEQTLAAHRQLYLSAPDLDEAVKTQKGDPKAVLKELSAAFDDLAAAALRWAPIAGTLHQLAAFLRVLADDHSESKIERKAHKWWREHGISLPWWSSPEDDRKAEDGEKKEHGSEPAAPTEGHGRGAYMRRSGADAPAGAAAAPSPAEGKQEPAKDAKDQKSESSDFWGDFWRKAWDGFSKTFGVSGARAGTLPEGLRFRVEDIRRIEAARPTLPKLTGKQIAALARDPSLAGRFSPSDIPGFGGSRSWRNNNPGNLRHGAFAAAHGATGADEKGFAVFPDEATGRSAQRALLFDSPQYAGLSIREALGKYAPASENDTGAYVRRVTQGLGVGPEARLADLAPEQREKMLDILREHEGWRPPVDEKAMSGAKKESSIFWEDFFKKGADGLEKFFGVSGAHAATLPDGLRFRPGHGRNALLRHAHIGAGGITAEDIRRSEAARPKLPTGKQIAALAREPSLAGSFSPNDIPGFGGSSRSWRNNNPGNLRHGAFAAAHGATGADEKGFAVFPDEATGRAAQRSLLFDSPQYAGLSIREALGKYAPASENDTGAYVRRVTQGLGVGPEARLADLAPEQREHMLDIMREHEGWRPAYRGRLASDAPAPAGTQPVQEGTTTIVTKGGRKLTVDARYAANFSGFLDDYEAAGGVVGPNSGGLGVRPGNASYHPIGRAIDINQVGRNIRAGGVTLPVETENRLAAKWGLRSGANFRSPDAGHFEVNDAGVAHEALKANGVIAKDAPAPVPPPLDQRGLANYLFGSPKTAREAASKVRTSAQMMQEIMAPPPRLSMRGGDGDGEIDGALGDMRGARGAWGSPIKARADISEIHALNDALRESIRLRERLHNIGGGASSGGRATQSGHVSMQSFDQIRRGGYSTGGGQGDW